MKRKHRVIKCIRSCDDWCDDESPYYHTGSAYELSDDAPRFRSVSYAAHRAMMATTIVPIGFHKPKP